jgi:hypothetical protein
MALVAWSAGIRALAQQLDNFSVGNYDIGRLLQGGKVLSLKLTPFLGGNQQHPSLADYAVSIRLGWRLLRVQHLIYLHHQLRQPMEPVEPGIIHQQIQKLIARIDATMRSLVKLTLAFQERFVQA